MNQNESSRLLWLRANALLLSFALVKLILHLFVNATGGYGFFRDELYYLACSEHPDLGYVDQPPLSIYILAVNRFLLGDSLFALRFLPAVAGAATVYLVGRMTRELGGSRFAQSLACVAIIVSPIKLGMDSVFSMNTFDHLLWASAAYLVIRLVKTDDSRYWLLLGVLLGLGLLNKMSTLWLCSGVFVGFLLTPHRRWFLTMWPWLAGLIGLLLFLPYIVWNLTHNLAHLEFIRNATGGKYASLSPLMFVAGQPLLQNPVTLPIWLTGLLMFLFLKAWRRYQVLGLIYVVAFLVLVFNQHSKPEYLSPAYAMLFAGGSVGIEQFLSRRSWSWVKPVYALVLVVSGVVLAPMALPVLPVETYIAYADALGIKPNTPEAKKLDKLPQFYADMFGWEEKVEAVARVYSSLSKEDQSKCGIFADNYGRCGAVDFFGKKYGLPKSIGKHNNYWIWGPRGYTGELMIILGGDLEDKQDAFAHVEVAGVATSRYCMPYENNLRIYVCRNLKVPVAELWPKLRVYN